MTEWIIPTPGMVITKDTTFQPGVYKFFEQDGITIAADNITLDGNGAVIIGGKAKGTQNTASEHKEFSYGYGGRRNEALGYNGIGLTCSGRSGVTIKGLQLKNFEIGILLEDAKDCQLLDNDCSYNYHNPDHGWDEHDDLGGFILQNSHGCLLQNNRANEVWSALVLRYSHKNRVLDNNFSHTSNVGLRLWRACENHFENNDFSWGLRINPGEVHARDSSSVLIETGSNDNRFINNDMRYGGDGLFIRSLNHWMSTGNYFEGNDTSFANNNAIEAWDQGNTYVRNIVSYSSYGFWLGNSDNTILKDNIIEYNGTCFSNAPENFGNAGIAVANGTGKNFVLEGNRICHNRGPGVAIKGLAQDYVRNWVVKNNLIAHNQNDARGHLGHGIYMEKASHVFLYENQITDNQGDELFLTEQTDTICFCKGSQKEQSLQVLLPEAFFTGKELRLAIKNPRPNCSYTWQVHNQDEGEGAVFTYSFKRPGLTPITLIETEGESVNFFCWEQIVKPQGIDFQLDWVSEDLYSFELAGKQLFVQDKKDQTSTFTVRPVTSIKGVTDLFLVLDYENEFLEEKDNPNPIITLFSSSGLRQLKPQINFINRLKASSNAFRYHPLTINIALQEDKEFQVSLEEGTFSLEALEKIEISFINSGGLRVELAVRDVILH